MNMNRLAIYLEVIENENCAKRICRRTLRDKSNPLELPDTLFVGSFRLNKPAFKYVLDELNLKIDQRSRSSIPTILKLSATLRFLASGSYQLSVGKDFDISMAQSTISVVMKEVLNILETYLCPKWIQFERNEEEQNDTKYHFYSKYGFPGVVGCVDGTHIAILPPAVDKHLFYNRKGFYSLNVLIICDEQQKIKYIDASHPGSTNTFPHNFTIAMALLILKMVFLCNLIPLH